jgi:hypothetical protein
MLQRHLELIETPRHIWGQHIQFKTEISKASLEFRDVDR